MLPNADDEVDNHIGHRKDAIKRMNIRCEPKQNSGKSKALFVKQIEPCENKRKCKFLMGKDAIDKFRDEP